MISIVLKPEIRKDFPPYQKEFIRKTKKTKQDFKAMLDEEIKKDEVERISKTGLNQ